MEKSTEKELWEMLDRMIDQSNLVIDREKGTEHPRFPDMAYPADYGYLEGTSSMDGGGIDVWLGTAALKELDAMILTADILKKDSEIKLLVGCTEAEKRVILDFHNSSRYMKGIMIERK